MIGPAWKERRKKERFKKSEEKKDEIVRLYTEELLSGPKIGEIIGCSRSYVMKVLNQRGIDTSKAVGCNITFNCDFCGKEDSNTRSKYKKNIKNFCSEKCRVDYIRSLGKDYIPWRQGTRIGRKVVESIYGELPEGSIVHHEDKNNRNNEPCNLILFKSNIDHMKWHRGNKDDCFILWRGTL